MHATKPRMPRIERLNSGMHGPAFMKRYHFANGGILITQPHAKRCRAIVPACPHISLPVERSAAARKLATERRAARS